MKKYCVVLLVLAITFVAGTGEGVAQYWDFPPLPPAQDFGNVLIDNNSTKNNVKPVYFAHWSHRAKYTCRVCHFELDFAFQVNGTKISEEENKNGLYCGACHDGKTAFGHTEENCSRCHTGSKQSNRAFFVDLARILPKSPFGNKIDWAKALETGRITPKYSIFNENEKPMEFRKRLELAADWSYVPPAYFAHATHTQWLDCANCHPDIFNIKQKETKHFSMKYILEDKFCGVCHLRVAFPINNCVGCHPGIKNN